MGDSLLTVATLQAALATSMVTVTTDNAAGTGAGIIQVVDPVTWTSDTSLSLHAAAGIRINGAITGGAGSRLELRTAAGNIDQTAPITVVTLSARADTGSVNLTHAGNQVQRLAGFANGAGGFNYRGNDTPLIIGVAGPEAGITSLGSGPIRIDVTGNLTLQSPVSSQAGDIVLSLRGHLRQPVHRGVGQRPRDGAGHRAAPLAGRLHGQYGAGRLRRGAADARGLPGKSGHRRLLGRVAAACAASACAPHAERMHRRSGHGRLCRGAAQHGRLHQRARHRRMQRDPAEPGHLHGRSCARGVFCGAADAVAMHRCAHDGRLLRRAADPRRLHLDSRLAGLLGRAAAVQTPASTPVSQALNTTVNIINTVSSTVSQPVAKSDDKQDGASKKDDTKEVAATDKTVAKNEPRKKTYCN